MTATSAMVLQVLAVFVVWFGAGTLLGHVLGHWLGDLESGYFWSTMVVTLLTVLFFLVFII